jgi:hypothetical protein
MLKRLLFAITAAVLFAFAAGAGVPQLINYQGVLVDDDGHAISGIQSIQFGIYDSETGGEPLWSETQNVVVTDGLFHVLLGAVTLIPHSVFDGGDKYLAVKVESDPEMTPRRQVVSVAYAYHSGEADSLDGYSASDFVQSLDGVAPDDGVIDLVEGANITIEPDAYNNRITISAEGGGDGDITAVYAGNGLTGGAEAGDADIHVGAGDGITVSADAIALNTTYADGRYVNENQNNSIATDMIQDNAVTEAEVSPDIVSSIDGVINDGGDIDLVAGPNIIITPDDIGNRVTIATTAMGDGHSLDAADGSPANVVYVDNAGEVGIGTTLPVSKMDIRGTLNVGLNGTGHDVNFYGDASGSRVFWNTSRRAFRAGIDAHYDYWSDPNTGLYSTAMGEDVRAQGRCSFAQGADADAVGDWSVAIGADATATGDHSIAMGVNVGISGSGSFIVGDNSSSGTLSKTGEKRFYARFANGYYLYTNATATIGAYLGTSANSWAIISDSTRKENFQPVDGESVLDKISRFRLGTWNYIGQDPRQYRHYGPMAQDFFAAFGHDGIGTIGNDTTLASADFDGINFIAIQALERRTSQLQKDNEQLRSEISELEDLLTTLTEDWRKLQTLIAESKEPHK